jgi:hypothetical protein
MASLGGHRPFADRYATGKVAPIPDTRRIVMKAIAPGII